MDLKLVSAGSFTFAPLKESMHRHLILPLDGQSVDLEREPTTKLRERRVDTHRCAQSRTLIDNWRSSRFPRPSPIQQENEEKALRSPMGGTNILLSIREWSTPG